MKISPFARVLDYLTLVREKSEDRAFYQENSKQGGSDSQKNPETKDPKPETVVETPITSADVDQAIEAFQTDLGRQENGLNVSIVGSGPGLRVILKDPEGAIVRSFTGKEFVRLRQQSTQGGRLRGKILDQKF